MNLEISQNTYEAFQILRKGFEENTGVSITDDAMVSAMLIYITTRSSGIDPMQIVPVDEDSYIR